MQVWPVSGSDDQIQHFLEKEKNPPVVLFVSLRDLSDRGKNIVSVEQQVSA